MDSYENLPDAEIKPNGEISEIFLELGITTFKEACDNDHNM
jgi:hypothetical protein